MFDRECFNMHSNLQQGTSYYIGQNATVTSSDIISSLLQLKKKNNSGEPVLLDCSQIQQVLTVLNGITAYQQLTFNSSMLTLRGKKIMQTWSFCSLE